MEARWNGRTIARSDATTTIEGNHYFPPDSVNEEYLQRSSQTSVCPWKGTASYYDLVVQGRVNRGAAWYYRDPLDKAQQIQGYIAFWRGVEILD